MPRLRSLPAKRAGVARARPGVAAGARARPRAGGAPPAPKPAAKTGRAMRGTRPAPRRRGWCPGVRRSLAGLSKQLVRKLPRVVGLGDASSPGSGYGEGAPREPSARSTVPETSAMRSLTSFAPAQGFAAFFSCARADVGALISDRNRKNGSSTWRHLSRKSARRRPCAGCGFGRVRAVRGHRQLSAVSRPSAALSGRGAGRRGQARSDDKPPLAGSIQ